MKKLVSVMVIAMVLALAFTVAANAEAWTPQTNGLYNFTYTSSEVQADAMYGMVVIEAATEPAEFELTQENIKYIDQVTANGNTLSFEKVGPMGLDDEENGKYYVYIGGDGILGEDGLPGAKRIGTLSTDPVEYYDIVFMNGSVEVKKVTKIVGETLLATDFPDVPAKAGHTGKWDVETDITGETTATITVNAVYEPIAPTAVTLDKATATVGVGGTLTLVPSVEPENALYTLEWSSNDNEVATVENGVVTAVAEGEATITVTIAGTDYKAECVVTVEEIVAVPGDVNGTGVVDENDAIYLLYHVLIDKAMGMNNYPLYPQN